MQSLNFLGSFMAGTQAEQQDGMRWFIGAFLVAILFTAFLMRSDHYLTFSPREANLGRDLRVLRSAQTTLPSRVSDPRQIR